MATTNIYPTIDGSIRATSGTSWNAVRDATSGTAATTAASDSTTAEAGIIMGTWFITRGFFTFAIPSNITITAATLRLTETTDASNAPNGFFIASTKADATAIVGADFNNVTFGTAYSSAVTLSGTVTTTLNAGAITALNSAVGGYFECAYVEDTYDYTDTDPVNTSNFGGIRYSEYSGTSSDPMLTLTYTETTYDFKMLSGNITIKGGTTTLK
tara:strand:- start:528 stop:1169 length:642 start_codon:yes stop_codon:yes gene_type:complete